MEIKVEQSLRTILYKIRRSKLHHCSRCDVVFIPDESASVDTDAVDSLLFTFSKELQAFEYCFILTADVGDFWTRNYALIAGAIGPNGYYTVDSNSLNTGVFANVKKIVQLHEQLMQRLESGGWIRYQEFKPDPAPTVPVPWKDWVLRRAVVQQPQGSNTMPPYMPTIAAPAGITGRSVPPPPKGMAQCPNCWHALLPNATQCSNCGWHTP
jgi:hypothetical protein